MDRGGEKTARDVALGLRIRGLGELVQAAEKTGNAPVDAWDPPYCGDIGMKIRADGVWEYGGSPIGRLRLVKLFSRILRQDADGRVYLVTPVEKVDVEVEDAPFLAVELDVAGRGENQVLTFRTNVDDVVVAGPDHPLEFRSEPVNGGLKPYLHVRGRLEALVTRALYYDLVGLAKPQKTREGNGERLVLWSSGVAFPLET